MRATWEELRAAGVDWMNFCEATGTNEWCRKEGLADDSTEFEFTVEQARRMRLLGEE
mgnify:CR=1 FL=1